MIKTDIRNNALVVSGNLDEVAPIEEFVSLIDSRVRESVYYRFPLSHIDALSIVSLLPPELQFSEPVILEESNSFIMQLSPEMVGPMSDYVNLIDVEPKGFSVALKYIKGEDLLSNPPPSVKAEDLIATNNPNLLFYKGSEKKL